MASQSAPLRVTVLGCAFSFKEQTARTDELQAGVIGLTSALKIQEGFNAHVKIAAEILADDPPSILAASAWAGAHAVPVVDDALQRQLEDDTLRELWDLLGKGEAPIMKTPHYTYFDEEPRKGLGKDLLQKMPGYRDLKPSELPQGVVSGCFFETVCIDAPAYLLWLSRRFKDAGGTFERRRISHIRELVEPGINVIIEAAGLGARSIGGIDDESMFPIRGQTVLIRAPWLKTSYGRGGFSDRDTTYIIPRPCGSVILGGVTEKDDWHAKARPETAQAIKERCLDLCPDILPPDKRADGGIEHLDIIREGCGLRPGRRGGVHCGVQRLGDILLIRANGFAGAGYQASLGAGNRVCDLLSEALRVPYRRNS